MIEQGKQLVCVADIDCGTGRFCARGAAGSRQRWRLKSCTRRATRPSTVGDAAMGADGSGRDWIEWRGVA